MAGLFLIAGIVAAAQASGMLYTGAVATAAVSITTLTTRAANSSTNFLPFIHLSRCGRLSFFSDESTILANFSSFFLPYTFGKLTWQATCR